MSGVRSGQEVLATQLSSLTYTVRDLEERDHHSPRGRGHVSSYQEVVVKVGAQVGHEVVVVLAVRDPEEGRVGDEEIVRDHHDHDVPPGGAGHGVLRQPGLRGHVEVVASPAAPALHVLNLHSLVQQAPAVALVLLLHVALQTVVTLSVRTEKWLSIKDRIIYTFLACLGIF